MEDTTTPVNKVLQFAPRKPDPVVSDMPAKRPLEGMTEGTICVTAFETTPNGHTLTEIRTAMEEMWEPEPNLKLINLTVLIPVATRAEVERLTKFVFDLHQVVVDMLRSKGYVLNLAASPDMTPQTHIKKGIQIAVHTTIANDQKAEFTPAFVWSFSPVGLMMMTQMFENNSFYGHMLRTLYVYMD